MRKISKASKGRESEKRIAVYATNKSGDSAGEWDSITEAAKDVGCSTSEISGALRSRELVTLVIKVSVFVESLFKLRGFKKSFITKFSEFSDSFSVFAIKSSYILLSTIITKCVKMYSNISRRFNYEYI